MTLANSSAIKNERRSWASFRVNLGCRISKMGRRFQDELPVVTRRQIACYTALKDQYASFSARHRTLSKSLLRQRKPLTIYSNSNNNNKLLTLLSTFHIPPFPPVFFCSPPLLKFAPTIIQFRRLLFRKPPPGSEIHVVTFMIAFKPAAFLMSHISGFVSRLRQI